MIFALFVRGELNPWESLLRGFPGQKEGIDGHRHGRRRQSRRTMPSRVRSGGDVRPLDFPIAPRARDGHGPPSGRRPAAPASRSHNAHRDGPRGHDPRAGCRSLGQGLASGRAGPQGRGPLETAATITTRLEHHRHGRGRESHGPSRRRHRGGNRHGRRRQRRRTLPSRVRPGDGDQRPRLPDHTARTGPSHAATILELGVGHQGWVVTAPAVQHKSRGTEPSLRNLLAYLVDGARTA